MLSSSCDFAVGNQVHGRYHDRVKGFPTENDAELFERLLLEINQAGLSWDLMLKKREGFRAAYSDFVVDQVAAYGAEDRARLLDDPRIIRNRLKVKAAIVNAHTILSMRNSPGGVAAWLRANHPMRKADWVKLFKQTFKFTGGEITGEFLMSIGYLPSAHREDCPVFKQIALLNPPWMEIESAFWE